jgi:hypothetical protein
LSTLDLNLFFTSSPPVKPLTTWRPASSPTRYLFAALPALLLPGVIWLWARLAERAAAVEYGPHIFLLGVAACLAVVLVAMVIYMAWCSFTLSYTFRGDDLVLRCGGVRHFVPLAGVSGVVAPGSEVNGKPVAVRWRGLTGRVPGYLVGSGQSTQIGHVLALATSPAGGLLYVQTPGLAYALSPERPLVFLEELNKRRAEAEDHVAGVAEEIDLSPRAVLSGMSAWGYRLWADPAARVLMLGGLALCALLFGYMGLVYASLPTHLPMHWNAQAQVDRIGSPQELLRLPVFALAVWLANVAFGWWTQRRERATTLFLLAGAVAAQVVFAAGVLTIVLRAT